MFSGTNRNSQFTSRVGLSAIENYGEFRNEIVLGIGRLTPEPGVAQAAADLLVGNGDTSENFVNLSGKEKKLAILASETYSTNSKSERPPVSR